MSNATFDGVLTDDVVLVCLADERRRRRVTEALREEWPVRTAVDGDAAADSLDDAVSVVVVDGDDVDHPLTPGDDDGFETVTLVDERPDDAEDRSGAWRRKPVAVDEIVAAVERRQRRVTYSRLLDQYYAVASEYAAATTTPDRDPEELETLKERLFAMRERLDEVADTLADVDAFDATLGDGGGESADE